MSGNELNDNESAISIEGLTRSFNDYLALRGITAKFLRGESTAVLGPNGAGKTTLLKVLSTAITPSSGEVMVNNTSLKDKNPETRRCIGVVSHQPFLYHNLTAYENLSFYCRMYDVEDMKKRITDVVDMVGMTSRLHDRVGTLSRGMQQRLSIGRAILHKPEILLLDEPDTGLDWYAMSSLWEIVRTEDGINRTIIFTTHDLGRGLSLSERIVIIHKGKIVFEALSSELDTEKLKAEYINNTGTKE